MVLHRQQSQCPGDEGQYLIILTALSYACQTLILAHVIIPSSNRVKPSELDSPTILEKFQVKEIIIRRFIAARMRD